MKTEISGSINISAVVAGFLSWLHNGITTLDLSGVFSLALMTMGMIGTYYTIKLNREKIKQMKRRENDI